jgi:hypothetical protein
MFHVPAPHLGSLAARLACWRARHSWSQDQNVNVAFEVQRTGDISTEIHVKYVVKDLASEKDDNRTFTGSVQIEAGRSSAEFRVPITNIREIIEDRLTQEATVIWSPASWITWKIVVTRKN